MAGEKKVQQLGSLCPQCGYDVRVDEDGCCVQCGATAVGDGADAAHRWREKARRLYAVVRNEVKRGR